jgi:hypothetical protein
MVKKIALFTLVLAFLMVAVGYSSPPAMAADNAWHYSSSGIGAEAYFTSCYEWTEPNTVCTDTGVWVAESVYREDGSKYPGTTMSYYQTQYKYDRRGNWIWISDTWGYGDATLTIDHKLTSAAASGDMVLTTCTPGRRGEVNCTEGAMITLSASWTGVGDLVRSNSNSHTITKGYKYNSHYSGTYRDASAQVSAMEPGVQYWAQLYISKWMDVYISHDGW